jgi:hypothetical protein
VDVANRAGYPIGTPAGPRVAVEKIDVAVERIEAI